MGFALLAGLPPAYGLYTAIFPGWIYYVFGTCRHLSMGTMALTALMVGAVVNREVSDAIASGRQFATVSHGPSPDSGFTASPNDETGTWTTVDDVTGWSTSLQPNSEVNMTGYRQTDVEFRVSVKIFAHTEITCRRSYFNISVPADCL
jgi:hypothetical protein